MECILKIDAMEIGTSSLNKTIPHKNIKIFFGNLFMDMARTKVMMAIKIVAEILICISVILPTSLYIFYKIS